MFIFRRTVPCNYNYNYNYKQHLTYNAQPSAYSRGERTVRRGHQIRIGRHHALVDRPSHHPLRFQHLLLYLPKVVLLPPKLVVEVRVLLHQATRLLRFLALHWGEY